MSGQSTKTVMVTLQANTTTPARNYGKCSSMHIQGASMRNSEDTWAKAMQYVALRHKTNSEQFTVERGK